MNYYLAHDDLRADEHFYLVQAKTDEEATQIIKRMAEQRIWEGYDFEHPQFANVADLEYTDGIHEIFEIEYPDTQE
jgi:hypothetical protein